MKRTSFPRLAAQIGGKISKCKKETKSTNVLPKASSNHQKFTVGALAGKSPKEFWRAVKQLQKETKENNAEAIPPRVWHN